MPSDSPWRLSDPIRSAFHPTVLSHTDPGGATIRAARPEDRDRIIGAFRALHPQSVYQRFFFAKGALSDRELRWLTAPGNDRKVVLVATSRHDGEESVVALAQYIRSGASAEVAFVVAETHRGRGIASRMLQQLADIAREHGVTQFEADVLADNAAMLKVFRRSKLLMSQSEADGIVHLTLSLGDRGAGWRAAWRRLGSRLPLRRFS